MDLPPHRPGELLRAYRLESGWTQAMLGERLGCDHSTVAFLESGRKYPGRRIANKIELLTRDRIGGPIRAIDWDRAEDVKRGRDVDWHVHFYAAIEPSSPEVA